MRITPARLFGCAQPAQDPEASRVPPRRQAPWEQVSEIATEQGRTATAVVIDALKRYVTWYRRQQRDAARRESNG